MNRKTIAVKIFLFCELVIALRILLFEIPVIINRSSQTEVNSSVPEERFIGLVCVVMVLFLMSSIAGLLRNRFWVLLHIIAAIVTGLGTALVYQAVQFSNIAMPVFYYWPLAFAFIVVGFVYYYRNCLLEKDTAMKKILIVDDDISIHKMLDPILSTNGFSVLSAKTGEEGLQMTQEHKPDIIILDVILPGMKGRAVCAEIKKNPTLKDIPVLFLTSKDSPDDVQAELEVGGIGHLTKPINPQYLVAQIKRVLG